MTSRKAIWIVVFLILIASALSAEDPIVYITKTGAKYHTATCSYLRKSKIPISLSDAIRQGYTPCSRCNPPVLVQTQPSEPRSQTPDETLAASASVEELALPACCNSRDVDTTANVGSSGGDVPTDPAQVNFRIELKKRGR